MPRTHINPLLPNVITPYDVKKINKSWHLIYDGDAGNYDLRLDADATEKDAIAAAEKHLDNLQWTISHKTPGKVPPRVDPPTPPGT